MAIIVIRDVPSDVIDELAVAARERGQSLQPFLLDVLERHARSIWNKRLLADIEQDLAEGGAAGSDAPDAATVPAQSKREHARDTPTWPIPVERHDRVAGRA